MNNEERRFRYVSLDGCKELGRGSHGITYRLNDEQLLKVYTDNSKLSTIEKERLSAKHAFLEGIPSGIAFDTVVTEANVWSKPVLYLMSVWAKTMLINKERKCIKVFAS